MAKETAPTNEVIAIDGDNYQTIAEGLGATDDVLAKAQALFERNNGNAIYPGTVVRTDVNA